MLPEGPQLGGAPANFTAMCAHLAAVEPESRATEVFLVSCVGEDPLGRSALDQLAARAVKLDHISIDPAHATGSVSVEFDSKGNPTYSIRDNVAWDYIPETSELTALARSLSAVCFGTLAQRSEMTRSTLRRVIEATRPECVRVFDVNLRDPYWTPEIVAWGCAHSTLLKMNHEEVPRIARALDFPLPDQSASHIAHVLLQRFPVELIAVTRGAEGSLLVTSKNTHDHPGIAANVVDLVGAGDAFTAALTLSVLRQLSLAQASEAANRWGAWAASQSGGMPGVEPITRETRNLPSKQ